MAMSVLFLTASLVLLGSFAEAADVGNSTRNREMVEAQQEMQRANYFTYVMLINMAPPNLFSGNVTLLMPNDKTLAKIIFSPQDSISDFLLSHSIPSPLLLEQLQHIPTGSILPTSKSDLVLRINNGGRKSFFLNNVKITSPNICTQGEIRCHGIDGIIHDTFLSRTPLPSAPPSDQCHNSPASATSPPPSAAISPPPTNSNTNSTNSASSSASPPTHSPKKSSARASAAAAAEIYFAFFGCMTVLLALLSINRCL